MDFEQFNKYVSKGNYTGALNYCLNAADQGDVQAQFTLGFMYVHDEWIEQDYSEAKKWFQKAAEQGHI